MKRKYIKLGTIITLLSSGILITSITVPILLQNRDLQRHTVNSNPKNDDAVNDQFEYIKKDVAAQTGIENSIKTIELIDSLTISKHTAAIVTKVDNSTLLYMWGNNDFGQLGNESKALIPTQTIIPNLGDRSVSQVALGNEHSIALLSDGSIYTWGYNVYKQLGFDSPIKTAVPTEIFIPDLNERKIQKIVAGATYSGVLLSDGTVYTWGSNSWGQLGHSSQGDYVSTPTQVNFAEQNGRLVTNIAFGWNHSAALLDDGSLYMWGSNFMFELGFVGETFFVNPRKLIVPELGNRRISLFALGRDFTGIVLNDSTLYMFGSNRYGQLGFSGSFNGFPISQPLIIPNLGERNITKIAFGENHSAALLSDGSLYMWGDTTDGKLGWADVPIPNARIQQTVFPNLNGRKVINIALGMLFSSAQLNDGSIFIWGNNGDGQIGNGSTTLSKKPVWLSQLGKDSHISINSSLTAREAVNNVWVNGVLNVDGIKNSFNLVNILEVPEQLITMSEKPIYDNHAGTIEMKIGIKYFYDENGLLTPILISKSTSFSGFIKSLTRFEVNQNPKKDIVIDQWHNSLKDEQGHIDRAKLEDYLQLTDVPIDAVFNITNIVTNYPTGVLKFNITSSITKNEDGSLSGESEPFPITLNLIARVTKITPRTNYKKIVVDKLKDSIFDENGVANIAEINKYVEISAPVDGAILNLKPNSYVIDTGMGTSKFTVFYDKYYDAAGVEQTQTPASIKQSFDISLDLLPMASVITSKSTYTPTHRVDRFMTAFSDANGKVTNETILKQYIDIENMPTGYSLSIKDYNIIDPIAGTVSFTVVASNYNDLNFVPQTDGEFPIQLLKLLPKFPTTDISAKTEADYDDTVRLDRFVPLFADETTGVVNNIDKLGEFLDLVSIPEDATLTIKNIKMTNAIGKITFNVEVSKYYDADSDLQNAIKSFPIELNLGIKYIPTEITANQNIIYPERVDLFETKITELSGTPELQTYLQSKYITIVGDLPKGTTFSVDNIVGVNETGIINFDLTASAFYDENSDRIENKVIPLELSLRIKYAPTVLVAKAKEDYTAQDRVDRFEHTIKMFKDQDLKTYLSNYVDGINTLVVGSTLVASEVVSEITTGAISFKLTTNKYYDGDSDLQVTTLETTIALELGIKHEQTTVTAKTGDFTHIVVDQFIPLFTDEQFIVNDKDELNKYVDITALPADANLSVKDANMTFSTGMIIFKIVADKFYDGQSDLITTFSQEYIIKLTLGIKYQATTVSAIKGYDQSENVETFANQIKTLTGHALKTYLDTYLQIKGDLPADAILSVEVDSITTDLETGKVSFNVQLDKYYDGTGSLQSNGKFSIKLKLAF